MNRKRLALVSSIAAGFVALTPISGAHAAGPARTITVNGTGSVQLVNDRATVDLSVSNMEVSASQAASATAANLSDLRAVLFAAGVSKDAISTTSVYVSPEISYDNNVRILLGYRATVSVSVKIAAGLAGPVVEAAVSLNDRVSVNGVNFSSSKSGTALAKARAAAVSQARTAANTYAKAAGARLGSVATITDSGSSYVYPYPQYQAKADGLGAPLVLDAGRSTVTATVTVVYALR